MPLTEELYCLNSNYFSKLHVGAEFLVGDNPLLMATCTCTKAIE